MYDPIQTIGAVFIVSFGIMTLASGVFTLYFGAGKSRRIGSMLLAIGAVVIAFFTYMEYWGPDWYFGGVDLLKALMVVIGVALGAIVGAGIFLLSIIKS